jgi:hypothetical protein
LLLDAPEGQEAMLRSLNDPGGYAMVAIDGPIGHVQDFVFDGPMI